MKLIGLFSWKWVRPGLMAAVAVAGILTPSLGRAQLNSAVTQFGDGGFGTGWQSDDTRNGAGTDIVNSGTHAPDPLATSDPTQVAAQIDWANFYGSRGNLGGVALSPSGTGSGKATISLLQEGGSGFGSTTAILNSGFQASWRWAQGGSGTQGAAFKIGIQSESWGSSQNAFTATRSGEASWDLILVAPTAATGLTTSSADFANTVFTIYGQAGNTYFSNSGPVATGTLAQIMSGNAAMGVGATLTAAQLATAVSGANAKVTNTQIGIGSGQATGNPVLDWASVSYLNSGAIIDFSDASKWDGVTTGTSSFTVATNWAGDVAPSSTQNVVFDADATYTTTVSDDFSARSIGASNGDVTIDVASGKTLTLNHGSGQDGYLFAEQGATLRVSGEGSTSAAVMESAGTVVIDSSVALTGGTDPHVVRDGTGTSRYGMAVYAGGTVTLQNGAQVTVNQADLNAGVRIGDSTGAAATLNIESGASLHIGNDTAFANGLTSNGFLVAGDWGSTGVVNQTGGEFSVTDGSFNLGNQGGTGTYNLSDGTVTLSGGLHSLGRNTGTRASGTGTMNLSGGTMIVQSSANNGPASFILGDRDASSSPELNGTGLVTQTGGILRVANGSNLFLGGHGASTYNLNGGALEIGGTSLQGLYQNPASGTYDFNLGGGTIKVIGSDLVTSVDANLMALTASVIDTNGMNATLSGAISGSSGGLVKTGIGKLTLATADRSLGFFNAANGTTAHASGTTTSAEFVVGSGSGANGTFSMEGGSLILNGAPSFGGSAASLRIGDFGGTGTFNQSAGDVSVTGSLNVANQGGAGTYNLSGGTATILNGFANLGRSTQATAGDGTLNLSNTGTFIVGDEGDLIIGDRDGAGAEGSGFVNQTGGTLRVQGTGELWIGSHGAGTYNLNGGTLEIGGVALKSDYASAAGGSAFNLGGGTIKVIGGDLATSVAIGVTAESSLDSNELNASLAGTIGGTGTLRKLGQGTLNLTAENSTANLQVDAGTLSGTGATSGDITVKTGASLTGALAAGGSIVIEAGATHAPGFSIVASYSDGAYLLQSGGNLTFELGGLTDGTGSLTNPISGEFDQLLFGGPVELQVNSLVRFASFNGYVPGVGDAFDVILTASAITLNQTLATGIGQLAGYQFALNIQSGQTYGFSSDLNAVRATVTAVPEPTTALYLLLAAFAGCARRRRSVS